MPLNGGCDLGEHVEQRLVGPVQVFDGHQPRRAFARALQQPHHELPALVRARGVVHALVDNAQILGQRHGEQVCSEHGFIASHESGCQRIGKRLLACRQVVIAGAAQHARHDPPNRVLRAAQAEIERERLMGAEAGRCGGGLELLDQAGLADPRLAAHYHQVPRTVLAACLTQGAELAQLDRASDQRRALLRRAGLLQAEHAPDAHRLIEAFDRHLANRLGDAQTR